MRSLIGHFLKARLGFAALLLFIFTFAARADILTCDICGKPMYRYYERKDLVDQKIKKICEECAHSSSRCYICEMPVKEGSKRLPDGRFICDREMKTVVESESDAKEICKGVKDDLDRLFSRFMMFPAEGINVSIVDQYHLEALFKAPGGESACVSIYGATSSHPLASHKFVHTVDLLSHMQKTHLMAVCAHEYTHTWLNENLPSQRHAMLDKDSVEGFCEFIAYKYMENRNEKDELEFIKRNHYTDGQVLVLLAADSKYGFNTVMDWMLNGEDSRLDMGNLDRVRALKDHVVSRVAAASATPELVYGTKPIAAPTSLLLKSISGSPARRFALINSTTFETNEKNRVKVGTNNFSVRCLEIRNDSVVIQVDDSPEKKQLFLSVK